MAVATAAGIVYALWSQFSGQGVPATSLGTARPGEKIHGSSPQDRRDDGVSRPSRRSAAPRLEARDPIARAGHQAVVGGPGALSHELGRIRGDTKAEERAGARTL